MPTSLDIHKTTTKFYNMTVMSEFHVYENTRFITSKCVSSHVSVACSRIHYEVCSVMDRLMDGQIG